MATARKLNSDEFKLGGPHEKHECMAQSHSSFIFPVNNNSARTSQETLRLHSNAQPVNAVSGNTRCLL
jgi:hypothetical protein